MPNYMHSLPLIRILHSLHKMRRIVRGNTLAGRIADEAIVSLCQGSE